VVGRIENNQAES